MNIERSNVSIVLLDMKMKLWFWYRTFLISLPVVFYEMEMVSRRCRETGSIHRFADVVSFDGSEVT